MNRRIFILLIVILIPAIPLILLFTGVIRRNPPNVPPVTLRYWTIFDAKDDVQGIIDAYRARHPYVQIEHRVVDFATYGDALLQALARDQGPDILSLPASWLNGYRDLLTPLPAQYAVYEISAREGFLRRQAELRLVSKEGLSLQRVQRDFVDVVPPDIIFDGHIYGLPLSIDTLALYYNRDLLNRAKIVEPPTTWDALVKMVENLTATDAQGTIIRSAVGMGTGKNVTRASDILSLLLLQNGAQMVDPSGRSVTFHLAADEDLNRGEQAITFYTDFANPNKEVYTWNVNQPESLDAFLTGKTAFFLGFSYHRPLIDAAATPLPYGIAPVPHINADGTDAAADQFGNPKAVNIANYWVEAVMQKSKNPAVAWDFLQFAAAEGRVESYLEKTGRVSALRSLLARQQGDLDLEVFATQALTAVSWYHGTDAPKMEEALTAMADAIVAKTAGVSQAAELAARQIQQTLAGR